MATAASDGFSIHPEEIQAQAPTFTHESEALGAALKTLHQSLDALGSPWGDDKQGKQFGQAYLPNQKTLLNMIGTLVKGLDSIGTGLSAHADNHTAADAHNANSMKA